MRIFPTIPLKNKSFTLVELVVVIFILALVSSLTFPLFAKLSFSSPTEIKKTILFFQKGFELLYAKKEPLKLLVDFKTRKFILKDRETDEQITSIRLEGLIKIKALSCGETSDGEVEFFLSPLYGLEPLEIFLSIKGKVFVLSWDPYIKKFNYDEEKL